MAQTRKSWLWASAMVALVLFVGAVSLSSRGHGTALAPPGLHKAGDVWTAKAAGGLALVWCPPGKFLMGSPATEEGRESNEVQHEVTLTQGFWLGQTEVTQGQWQAVMGKNPSYFPKKLVVKKKFLQWWIPVWRTDLLVNRWQFPVEQVSWDDCQKFCQRLNEQEQVRLPAGYEYRLPTEAEWEYACRSGGTGPFAGTGVMDEMGWHGGNSGYTTHAVAKKRPNAWGLYDMHGNVCEWCQDYSGDYPTSAVIDPTGPATEGDRVSRGGSWGSWSSWGSWGSGAHDCRAASRGAFEQYDDHGNSLGFRIALAPAGSKVSAKDSNDPEVK